ncbi:MAG: DUF305 domain-containing protein [Candidatus Eiseniibacteriota bacterium]
MRISSPAPIRPRWALLAGIAIGAAAALAASPERASALADQLSAVCGVSRAEASPEEAPFLAENDAVMTKMMAAMAVRPTGDVDRDFVASMVPHHQGAIDMAQAELRYGHNEQLRRIAQEIIVEQQQEIAAMHLAIGQPLPPSVPSPDQPPAAAPQSK